MLEIIILIILSLIAISIVIRSKNSRDNVSCDFVEPDNNFDKKRMIKGAIDINNGDLSSEYINDYKKYMRSFNDILKDTLYLKGVEFSDKSLDESLKVAPTYIAVGYEFKDAIERTYMMVIGGEDYIVQKKVSESLGIAFGQIDSKY